MANATGGDRVARVITTEGLQSLLKAAARSGYEVVGPTVADGAIVYDTIHSLDGLPVGVSDEQQGGSYRLVKGPKNLLFHYVVGPHSWKRFLYPPVQRLWRARRRGKGFAMVEEPAKPIRRVFLGVRACELKAIELLDRVFDNGDFRDPGYLARRGAAFVIAVNCTRAGNTCFCTSMGTGPQVEDGFDLALTELKGRQGHRFLIETGSARGAKMLARVPCHEAEAAEIRAARTAVQKAARSMGRKMPADAGALLKRNLNHPQWEAVADRCLGCANCTMVCPTCFCTTTEDVTDLTGDTTERRRRWDSCYTLDFSYIHGGNIRRRGAARYRQWITHKLATWHDQFGASGCTGCGRCITWCPVGIDITEEVQAIRAKNART
jgi:ferredoxin